ncbi:hypothetical protein BHE74_00039151 [Ensete ventricosum]|nr:hypothetical protein BHE74_00039151 [Ensete ventricosum]
MFSGYTLTVAVRYCHVLLQVPRNGVKRGRRGGRPVLEKLGTSSCHRNGVGGNACPPSPARTLSSPITGKAGERVDEGSR